MDALPEISLGTTALIIFGLCAGYMVLRGITRTFINSTFLLVSSSIGFRVWQEAPALSISLLGKQSQIIEIGLPLIAGIATLIILRKLLKLLFRNPLEKSYSEDGQVKSPPLLLRLVCTLIPAVLICVVAAKFINHASSVAELKNSVETSSSSEPTFAEKIKKSISLAIPESLMAKLDPLTTQPRIQLAKLIASQHSSTLEEIIDPETGEPYPRAIIVDDPELVTLAKQGNFSALLRHPLLTEALEDPEIRSKLGLK